MKKFQLQLDTDSINKENEQHSNFFHMKIKNLAEHCIKFIEGIDNEINCTDNKFDKNIHETQELTESTYKDNESKEVIKNIPKLKKQIIQFQVTEIQNVTQKLLM